MEKDFVKRLVTMDGGVRITIYRDNDADNPRYGTDEPLHCEDWSRDYSIMTPKERETKSASPCKLLQYLLGRYADYGRILDILTKAGRDNKAGLNDKLVYDRSARQWVHYACGWHYNYEQRDNVDGWYESYRYDCIKGAIDVDSLLDELCDSTIDYLTKELLTDAVKLMSYSFGYYGEMSFWEGATCDSEGIAWFEKKEFLKYSGCPESYWKEKGMLDIDWLHEELEAWSNNEVYGFRSEELDRVKVHETHQDGSEKSYEREDWNEKDSCWGFYGELDKRLGDIVECAGYKLDDLKEAA